MAKIQVIFLGKDLYDLGYVSSIPDIIESKGFGRGKLTPSDFTLTVKNIDNQFSIDNPVSFLNNIKWQYKPLTIYDTDGILIFHGIVQNILRDHNTKLIKIPCKDIIFKNRKTAIEYESSGWETPITASKNLMDAESIDYDSTSITNSINQLDDLGCCVKVNFNKSDNISIFQAIQKLGIYGCADTYMHLNKVYQQFWQAYTGGISIDFDYGIKKKRPRTAPVIGTLEKSMYNDYNIGYDGDLGTAATDSNSNNIGAASRKDKKFGTQGLPEMRCGDINNQIVFKDKTSAITIGEAYIQRGHYDLSTDPKILQQCVFDVDYSYRQYTEIGAYFKMTFLEEAWDDKVWEIAGIKKSLDKQNINITAWEVSHE